MSNSEKSKKIELNEVMLAMDVVDTLRHQRSLVERELRSDEYEQALVEKVRKIYSAQGLKVTEEVIIQGVKALREDRFTYDPPKWSFQLMMARIYVKRGKWAKIAGFLIIAIIAVYSLYNFLYVRPSIRSQQKATKAIHLKINAQKDQIQVSKVRLDRLKTTISKSKDRLTSNSPVALKQIIQSATVKVRDAERKIEEISKLPVKTNKDAANLGSDADVIKQRVVQRTGLITALTRLLDDAEAMINGLDQYRMLPDKLIRQRDQIIAESKERSISNKAKNLYQNAMSALQQGDITATQKASSSLEKLYAQVIQEYHVRIASRPGMKSGVWRVPATNPRARNYYLIVEAVMSDGRQVTVPILNEEDGKIENVTQWGIRVSESVFEQVKKDKQDDGIINRNIVGQKKRGYLHPKYVMPIKGGAITKW